MNWKMRLALAALLIWTMAASGCEDGKALPGRYKTQSPTDAQQAIELQLGADGQGAWITDDDRVALKWDSTKGNIFLHTRTGGILQGRISNGGIELAIPGGETLIFKPTKD